MQEIISRDSAKASGDMYFYTGVSCKRGHFSVRYTKSGACKECHSIIMVGINKRIRDAEQPEIEARAKARKERSEQLRPEREAKAKEYRRQWRIKNAAHVKAVNDKWRAENQEKMNATTEKWRKENPHKTRQYTKAWYQRNPVKNKEKEARRWQENKDELAAKNKKWRENNKDVLTAYSHNYVSQKKNRGTLSRDIKSVLYQKQKGKCVCCGQPLGKDYHLDHIFPLSKGGSNTDDNVQLLRKECNLQKNAMHPVDFMQMRGFLI